MSTEDGGRSPRCCPGRDPARPRPSRCSSLKITWSKPPTCCAGRIRPMSRRTSSRAVPNEFYGPRAVGRDFRSIGERAVPSRKFRRWGDGVGTPRGDGAADYNRPGANPPHTCVDAVPWKSRSSARDVGADVPRRLRQIGASSNAARDGSQMFASQVRRPVGPRCPGPKHSGVRSEARVPLTAVALGVV